MRALLRVLLVIIILVALGAFFFGYRWRDIGGDERAVGTTGASDQVDTSRARQTGAEVGQKVAEGANQAQRAMSNASLTAKIKAKMALDDTIDAGRIDVDTEGSVVTLSGTVRTEGQRTRALQLARETDGVTTVNDHLTVSSQ